MDGTQVAYELLRDVMKFQSQAEIADWLMKAAGIWVVVSFVTTKFAFWIAGR